MDDCSSMCTLQVATFQAQSASESCTEFCHGDPGHRINQSGINGGNQGAWILQLTYPTSRADVTSNGRKKNQWKFVAGSTTTNWIDVYTMGRKLNNACTLYYI